MLLLVLLVLLLLSTDVYVGIVLMSSVEVICCVVFVCVVCDRICMSMR